LDDDGNSETVVESLDEYPIKSVTDQDSHPAVKAMDIGIGKMKNMFPVMSVIFVFIGFISIFMTVYRTVQNDSRLIGVLMALGYNRKEIIRSYMSMGLVLSIIGCILGLLFSFMFTAGIASGMQIWVKDFKIVFPFSPLPFIIGIIYTTFIVMISVYIPVRLITRTTVREALEYKPRSTIRTSRLFSGKLSKISLMGIRNATRHPLRLLITVFVVAITLGTAGAWLIMTDSAVGYIDEQLATDTWDLRADFLTPAQIDDVDSSYLGLNTTDTEYVIPFSFLTSNVRKGSNEEAGAILGCDEMKTIKDFSVREGSLDFNKAVISNKLADDLDASVGDTIKLDFGTEEIKLKVSAVVYDVVAHSVYTSRTNIQDAYSISNCSGAFIKLTEPSTDEELAQIVRNNPNVSKVVVHSTISDSLKDFFNEAMAFLYIFFLISLGIAFVVASSAVVISTMERDVEYATLKTLGITRGQVAKSILLEMGILSGLAAIIGIPFAYLFAFVLAKVMEQVVFFFPIYFTPWATFLTFLFGFIFVLLAAVVPIRYSAKLDTEKTIRERTAG
jgi:putative ABC transport system permease protein